MNLIQTYEGSNKNDGAWVAARYNDGRKNGLAQFLKKNYIIPQIENFDSALDGEFTRIKATSPAGATIDLIEKKHIRLDGFPYPFSMVHYRQTKENQIASEDRLFVTSYNGLLIMFRYTNGTVPEANAEAENFIRAFEHYFK